MRGIIIALVLLASPAAARDFGQWENQPPHVRAWFQDDGNPTGHGIIFIGMGGQVYCYVPPGGV